MNRPCMVAFVVLAGCYESHPRLPPPCFPDEPTLIVEDETCTEMLVELGRSDAVCGSSSPGDTLRATPFRVVNLSAVTTLVRLSVAEGTDVPVSYGDFDSATCSCFSITHLSGSADACFAAFPVAPGATRELSVASAGAVLRVGSCPQTDPPRPGCRAIGEL